MNLSFRLYAFALTVVALSGCASQGKPPPSISLDEPVQAQPLPLLLLHLAHWTLQACLVWVVIAVFLLPRLPQAPHYLPPPLLLLLVPDSLELD